jgi:hypothetical protein
LVEDGVVAFVDEGVQFRDGVAARRPGKELLLVHVKLRSFVAQGAGVVVRVVLLVLVLPTLGAGGPLRDQNKSTIYDKTLIDTNSQQKACQKLRNSRMSSKKFQKCRGCRGFWLFLLKNPVDQALGFEVWAGTRASTRFQAGKVWKSS